MKRKRILVVDDDSAVRQLYRTVLLMGGFDVDTAEDGISALTRIDEEKPDLIVLDLHLPCVDGVSVLGELRANTETWSIPVVVVTGNDSRAAAAQASAILCKPCEPERLLSVIERHLSSAA